ncbi:FG-GAP repeat domain-containing protein [Nonomuraea dietziae]|uniref:FG-GAP repeat domain-containing protein n=1 Tax=Nonomuraea dietziae TaxID=65515 RepID=UPI0033E30921
MHAKKITRSAVLLALAAALAIPGGQAQAATPTPKNTDFNGDGYNDLALGSPNYAGEDGSWNRGLVTVLYGGPDGFDGHWSRRPPVGCTAPNGRRCYAWGRDVSAGDLDADGRTDLLFAADDGMRVQSWTPQGVTEIEYHGNNPTLNPVGVTLGQFDDQPGGDIVGAWDNGNYQSVVGGWYNRDVSTITGGSTSRTAMSRSSRSPPGTSMATASWRCRSSPAGATTARNPPTCGSSTTPGNNR